MEPMWVEDKDRAQGKARPERDRGKSPDRA